MRDSPDNIVPTRTPPNAAAEASRQGLGNRPSAITATEYELYDSILEYR